jgi:hypothetical protein
MITGNGSSTNTILWPCKSVNVSILPYCEGSKHCETVISASCNRHHVLDLVIDCSGSRAHSASRFKTVWILDIADAVNSWQLPLSDVAYWYRGRACNGTVCGFRRPSKHQTRTEVSRVALITRAVARIVTKCLESSSGSSSNI